MLIIYDLKINFLGRHYVVNRRKYTFCLMTEWMGTVIKKLNESSTNMYYATHKSKLFL